MKRFLLLFLLLALPAHATNMRITQGEDAILNLTLQTGAGAAFDVTGGSFTTYISGSRGSVNTFANAKHAIVSASAGTITLTLSETDTALLSPGLNKEIVTKVVQGARTTIFRAQILDVKSAVPSP